MPVPLLPRELTGVDLTAEIAWGADLGDTDGWQWTDVTQDVRHTGGIEITTGRSDEASSSQPAECRMLLDNTRGDYSLGGQSPNWPHVRRNTPVRVRVLGLREKGLELSGRADSYIHAGDVPQLGITGDFDFRIELKSTKAKLTAAGTGIARKYHTVDNQRSWALYVLTDNVARFRWSPDGSTLITHSATVALGDLSERQALRITLDVDDGAANYVLTFYTSDAIDGTWTQLGSQIVEAGTTSIFDSAEPVELGRTNADPSEGGGIATDPFSGTIYEFELRDGIDGTVVADADFTNHESTVRSFTDDAGLAWTLAGQAFFTTEAIFQGYTTGFTPTWNVTGTVATVQLAASGALRRLNQRTKPLRSSLYRDFSTKDDVVAYWPLEEGKRAAVFASGLANDTSTLVPSDPDEIEPAAFDEVVASAPLPTFGALEVAGDIPAFAAAVDQRAVFLFAVPEEGVHATEDRALARPETQGTVRHWLILITPSGDLYLEGRDSSNVTVFTSPTFLFGINGKTVMVSLWLQQDGATTHWQIGTVEAGSDVFSVGDGSVTTTYGRFTRMRLGDGRGMNDTAYGHAAVLNDDVHSIWDVVTNSLKGWASETAADRLVRLCGEHRVPLRVIGDSDVAMGPQGLETLLTLLRECEAADQGVLYDGTGPGLVYVARDQRENAPTALTVDVSAAELAAGFDPADDDQRNVNEATATQKNGSSVTVSDLDGPLGVNAVGLYDEAVTVNVDDGSAENLGDHASWMVHLGTVEGYRFPSVSLNLRAAPDLAAGVVTLGPSSRVDVANPSSVFPQLSGDIPLLVEGIGQTVGPHQWDVTLTSSPYSPWRVIVLADDTGDTDPDLYHLDTDGSELDAAAATGATSLSVATTAGPLWTTTVDDFPFLLEVAGIPVTVTAISGTTRTQTCTVTGADVTKDLAAGDPVRVWRPPTLGL